VKIGPRWRDEVPSASLLIFLDDLGAGDVRRHQVRRELHAAKAEVNGIRQGLDQERLGQPRHTFQQAVTTRAHGNKHLLDDVLLTDDAFGECGFEFGESGDEAGTAAARSDMDEL